MPNYKATVIRKAVFTAWLYLFGWHAAADVDGKAVWDNKCEECHGDPAKFAAKYLWNIDGQLQGQHHVEDLDRYLRQHYVPGYAFDSVRTMLLQRSNSPVTFDAACAECHGELAGFVEKSIWVRGNQVTGMESGKDIRKFLPTHQNLQARDVSFYLKLFARTAGKPFYDEEPLLEAITR